MRLPAQCVFSSSRESYAEKGETTAKVTWLTGSTTYNYSGVANAKIVKISDGKYAVMWNSYDSGGSVNYVMVNGRGEIISGLKKLAGAELTECQPVLSDGMVSWLKYSEGERQVYTITDFSCTGSYEIQDTYAESVDPWNGTADANWYNDSANEFTLNTPDQLAGLTQLVNEGNTFEGKKIFPRELSRGGVILCITCISPRELAEVSSVSSEKKG